MPVEVLMSGREPPVITGILKFGTLNKTDFMSLSVL